MHNSLELEPNTDAKYSDILTKATALQQEHQVIENANNKHSELTSLVSTEASKHDVLANDLHNVPSNVIIASTATCGIASPDTTEASSSHPPSHAHGNDEPAPPANEAFKLAIELQDQSMTLMASILSYCSYSCMLGTAEFEILVGGLSTVVIRNPTDEYMVGLIVIDTPNKRIYISFGGTEDWTDLLTDLNFFPKKFCPPKDYFQPIFVHRGMYKRMLKYYPALARGFATVKEQCRNNFEVIFCGHSMGGSVALLASYKLYADFEYERFGGPNNRINQFKWVTFGSPRVINQASRFFGKNENHLRFMCNTDIITRILYKVYEHTGVLIKPKSRFMRYAYALALDRKGQSTPLCNLLEGDIANHDNEMQANVTRSSSLRRTNLARKYIVETHSSYGYCSLALNALLQAQKQYLDADGNFIGDIDAMPK